MSLFSFSSVIARNDLSFRGNLILYHSHLSFSLIFNARRTTHNESVTASLPFWQAWQSHTLSPASFPFFSLSLTLYGIHYTLYLFKDVAISYSITRIFPFLLSFFVFDSRRITHDAKRDVAISSIHFHIKYF